MRHSPSNAIALKYRHALVQGKERGEMEGRKEKKSRQLLEQATPQTTLSAHAIKTNGQTVDMPTQPQELRATTSELVHQLPPQCLSSEFSAKNVFDEKANGVRFGLAEYSHSRVNFDQKPFPDFANFSITFEMHSKKRGRDGLLWVWANYRNFSRYFVLQINGDGFLQMSLKGHKQSKTVEYRAKRLDDGQWHRVEMEKRGKEMSLKVDEMAVEKLLDTPNPKVMRRRMYVGGMISKHRRIFADHLRDEAENELARHSFVGCIRRFRVDGKEQRLLRHSRDLVPCADSPQIAYIHEGGYATFESLSSHANKRARSLPEIVALSANFRIFSPHSLEQQNEYAGQKTHLLFGLLFVSNDSFQTNRLLLGVDSVSRALLVSIHLSKWRVHFDVLFDGSAPSNGSFSSLSPSLSPLVICPGQWGRVSLRLSSSLLSLSLNGQSIELGVSIPRPAIDNLLSLPVTLGGTTAPVGVSLAISSLNGCIKHFAMNGIPVNIEQEKTKWHKMVADGCPIV